MLSIGAAVISDVAKFQRFSVDVSLFNHGVKDGRVGEWLKDGYVVPIQVHRPGKLDGIHDHFVCFAWES